MLSGGWIINNYLLELDDIGEYKILYWLHGEGHQKRLKTVLSVTLSANNKKLLIIF